MPDVQILAPGDENAPLPYVVLGSQRIIPKALFATFDGSGAGGSFLPCIRILSPAGEVVGEYVTDEAVAAGSSADVSFAPFLRGAQSSAAAAASYAIFDAFSQTVVGTTATMRWGLTSTTDAANYSVDAGDDKRILVATTGFYLLVANVDIGFSLPVAVAAHLKVRVNGSMNTSRQAIFLTKGTTGADYPATTTQLGQVVCVADTVGLAVPTVVTADYLPTQANVVFAVSRILIYKLSS